MLADVSDVVPLLSDLIAIDSVNPGLVPGAAGERRIVEMLADRLSVSGFETRIIEADDHDDRPSLLAWTPQSADRTVLLNGHLDTVGVEGMTDPFRATRDGDRLTGRGACDMKGGCAALVIAAETLARDITAAEVRSDGAAPPRVVLALVADEEDGSLGTEAVLRALPTLDLAPDVAVVAEPTWLDLATTHRGYAVAEVRFSGRAAHSSQPGEGINAVSHLARFLGGLAARAAAVELGGGSLMVTVVEGGSAPFIIPACARAIVDRRTVPGEQAAELVVDIQDVLDDLGSTDSEVAATVTLTHAREAWQLAENGPSADLADRLGEALAERGHPRGDFSAPYWMESALWEAAGIPTVVCGPAGGGLHAIDEWVSVEQVETYAAALGDAVTRWAHGADRAH